MWLDVKCLQSSSAIFPKKSVIFQPYNGSTPNQIIPFCYFLFLWASICVLWMLEGNQVFSNLGIIQSEINVNPQSTLPGLLPGLIMLSSPWVSDAKFGVSNWSAAEMRQKSATVWSLCVVLKSVSEQKKKTVLQCQRSGWHLKESSKNLVNLFFSNPQCRALLFFTNMI